MSATGFSTERAARHDAREAHVLTVLVDRGYRPVKLAPDGDRPDIKIYDHLRRTKAYVDVKAALPGQRRVAVKVGALDEYRRISIVERCPVYIVAMTDWETRVDTVDSLLARVIGGPRRASGNGSLTDWYLFEHGGTSIWDFFRRANPTSSENGGPSVIAATESGSPLSEDAASASNRKAEPVATSGKRNATGSDEGGV